MFKISIPKIVLDGLTHKGTHWQVANDPSFDSDSLLIDDYNEDNKTEYMVDLPLTEDDIYYVRTKLKFDDDSETDWSKILTVTKGSDGFTTNSTIISTPKIYSNMDPNTVIPGKLVLSLSDYMLFTGSGTLESVDWVVEDIDGREVWSRYRDKANINGIVIPIGVLKPAKCYVIKARFNSNTNVSSNWGKKIIKTLGVTEAAVSNCISEADFLNEINSYVIYYGLNHDN